MNTYLSGLCLLLCLLSGCGERSERVLRATSQRDVNEALVEFTRAGVVGATVQDRSTQRTEIYEIRVPVSQATRARQVMLDLELPRERQPGFDELMSSASLIPTATEERARLMYAISGEIARTIELVDGVVAARVHVVLPDEGRLSGTQDKRGPSAVVLVKYREGNDMPQIISENRGDVVSKEGAFAAQIQELVENALGGFGEVAQEVTVSMTPVAAQEIDLPQQSETMPAHGRRTFFMLASSTGVLGVSTLGLAFMFVVERRRRRAP